MKNKNNVGRANVDTSAAVISALIKSVGFQDFVIGFHNAMCHGKALEDADLCFTEEQLGKAFEGIEILLKVSKEIH